MNSAQTGEIGPARRHDAEAARRSAQARPRQLARRNGAQLAQTLGWMRVGLGLVEVAAPRAIARWIGVVDRRSLISVHGLRQLSHGLGLLSQPRTSASMKAGLGGDAMDFLTLLRLALRSAPANRTRAMAALGVVAGVTALDTYCRRQLRQPAAATDWEPAPGVDVRDCVTINKPASELYAFWRDLRNLPRVMAHLQRVEVIDERHSHWVANAPAGLSVEWDAEIVEDQPDELIAWRSLPGADIDNFGSIRFEPARGGRGTVVRVELRYDPPAGKLGSLIAKLFGEEPAQQIDGDLRRFKQLMETGEIATTEGQSSGRRKT